MKKLLLICFLLGCVSADMWAQHDKARWWNYKGFGLRGGYGYQRGHYLELHAFRYYTKHKDNPKIPMLGYFCWGGGGEIELAKNPSYAFKVYTEYNLLYIGARSSICYYRNSISSSLIFTPEIGFSIIGTVYAYLGYAIPVYQLGNYKFHGLRLSIGFSIVDLYLGLRD